MDERIKLGKVESVNSVNVKNFLDVEMGQHSKVFNFQSISNTIDQRELFEKEREESTKYRLILTVNPYCTNILYNAVTEIVQNEGTDEPSILNIASNEGIINAIDGAITQPLIDGYEIKGKVGDSQNPLTDADMIRNTEYSNGDNPFVYHCGYNIFNNHILRNKTFKLVNPMVEGYSFKFKNTLDIAIKDDFNTIRDFMRYADGTEIKLTRRTDVNTIEGINANNNQNNARHLYLREDVMSYIESIDSNLFEQNGWWGFNNRSSIPSCQFDGTKWDDMKISRVINGKYFDSGEEQNHVSCEFIEMYPDSTLFSFNPKYNIFQNRQEQNWDIVITYPYENDESADKILINGFLSEDNYVNSLLIADYVQTKGTSGQDILMFRSFVKHNLNVGDKFKLYYKKSRNPLTENGDFFSEIEDREFEVVNTGTLDGEYFDYYFYINDVNEIKGILEIYEEDKIESGKYCFRFAKVVNGIPCKYYYRKFRKVPNLKFKKEELTSEIVHDKSKFEEYIDNNCRREYSHSNEMIPFSKEQYPLAFSNTIYGDKNTQIVFNDTIDINNLVDNLNRPLTELFVTFVKRNKGHELWYKKKKTKEDLVNIEFSHCFGKLSSGLEVHGEWSDGVDIKNVRRKISDCTLITNSGDNYKLNEDIQISGNDNSVDYDTFYGDVVEFDAHTVKETVLSEVNFRFNTEQREHDFLNAEDDEIKYNRLIFDEIDTDDYDLNNFDCVEYEIDDNPTYRPEGYYYKAHYPISVREFGSIRQGHHKEISVINSSPRQANGMFIEVVSSISTGVSNGDIVYLCDDSTDEMIPLSVNSVVSNVRFLINPMEYGTQEYKSVFDIVEGLLHSDKKTITQEDIDNEYKWQDEYGNVHIASDAIPEQSDLGKEVVDYSKPKYVLRLKDKSIPEYAYKIGKNTYLWRDVLNVGNKDAVELTEYPFANGHFYIGKMVNFFLKRQDPFNYNGLYAGGKIPNDIFGNSKKESNYEYKDETHDIC